MKHIYSEEVGEEFAMHLASTVLSRTYSQNVGDVLKKSVDCDLVTVRIMFLSQGSWTNMASGSHGLRHASEHIRTVMNAEGVKCLEMRLDEFDEWDKAVLRHALLAGLSVSVLVFRFATLEGLGKCIGRSKEITDKFPGITSDVERIMFVDASTTINFADTRRAVQDFAVERRLFEPRAEKDVLFEAADGRLVDQDISERAKRNRSILHGDLKGPCRPHLEEVMHTLNREVTVANAREESKECARFLLRLKSAINTKVTVKKDPQSISVCRGDSTGFGTSGTKMTNLL